MLSNKPELHDFVPLYGMISRMQVICSPRTIAAAQHVARTTLETYLQPNKTFEEILVMMRAGTDPSPLSEFAEAAREELQQLGS
jgi:precorrin-2 methylase